jgi:hypothetical protein
MLGHLQLRNDSILAHGFAPVDEPRWNGLHRWVEDEFRPMLGAELAARGIRLDIPQLPADARRLTEAAVSGPEPAPGER